MVGVTAAPGLMLQRRTLNWSGFQAEVSHLEFAENASSPGGLDMPAVLSGVTELLAGATDIRPLDDAPGKSGARLDRLTIGDSRYVVKYLDPRTDWTMRASGVLGGPVVPLWSSGILDRLPDCFNQPIVGVAVERAGLPDQRTAVLMRDVGSDLIPAVDDPIPLQTHLTLMRHMAAMHAAFWNAGTECNVVPVMHRYLELSPWTSIAEESIGSTHLVPQLIGQGWKLLSTVAPAADAVVTPLAWDPGPLVEALANTPQVFVHGNWKLDNLGIDSSGRTILIDWELPGLGAPLSDLAWYLAINCRRLPQSKETTIDAYRNGLEGAGIDTGPWWDRQLALSLLGALVQFGWEKAFGGYDDELAWWEAKAVAGARLIT
jgi:Phosphotransferase enzyme family